MIEDRGTVKVLPNSDVEWEIPDLDTPSMETDSTYLSPFFDFGGETWYFQLWLKGNGVPDTFGNLDMGLWRESSDTPIGVRFSFAVKTLDGQKDSERQDTKVFEMREVHFTDRLLSRDEYRRRKSEFLIDGCFTIVCTIKILNAECFYCKRDVGVENISAHENTCMERPIQCPACSDLVPLNSWLEGHECHDKTREAYERITRDFKAAMLNGEHSDVTVKVQGEELRLHKVILAARSPYFNSMFKTDMREALSGIVTIQDCDPRVFCSFVIFLYTEKVDDLSPQNVCGLYEASDKYQEDELKKQCLHLMLNTLSTDNFCDYFALALRYDEQLLFQKAVEFFIPKAEEIERSVQWQTFVKDYPMQANELLLKAFGHA